MCKRADGRAGKFVSYLFAVALILASAAPLRADVIYVQIDAESGGESASFTWAVPKVLDANGHMDWLLSSPLILGGANGPLATVDVLQLGFDGDPGVSLSFAVTAGGGGTNFTITSSYVNFATLVNPVAYASAGITLTDIDGNGATVTGLYPSNKCYEAHYNAANTVYAQIVSGISAGSEQTVVTSERSPLAGRTQILASVDRIQSQFHFSLSALDEASGTSRFDVQPVPEPGTLALVGTALVSFIGIRVRRRLG